MARQERLEGRALTRPECLLASLTSGTLRVLEELLTLARLNRGRVFPSYDHLADATGLGRATVARARSSCSTGPGSWSGSAGSSKWRGRGPAPLCEIQREADRCEGQGAMLASLSCRELAQATIGGQLGKMLTKLGAGIVAREREYQNGPQPLTQSYDNGISGAGLVGQQRFA